LNSAVSAGQVISYRWFKGGIELTGETGPTLTVPGITFDQAGTYAVEIAGTCNTVTNSATITVVPSPAFSIHAYDTASGSFSGIFDTVAGLRYIIEYKTNLTDSAWTLFETYTGDGNPGVFTDSPAERQPSRFYRMRLE
jgi:hypothetical protein